MREVKVEQTALGARIRIEEGGFGKEIDLLVNDLEYVLSELLDIKIKNNPKLF